MLIANVIEDKFIPVAFAARFTRQPPLNLISTYFVTQVNPVAQAREAILSLQHALGAAKLFTAGQSAVL